MTDLAASEAPATQSTTLEPNAPVGPSGGGAVTPPAEEAPKEPASLRDVIAEETKKDAEPKEPVKDDAEPADKADKDGKAEGEKADKQDQDKPEAKAKADADDVKPAKERDDTGKFKAKAEPVEDGSEAKDDKPGHYQPPKNFLPDSREKWTNVPRPVQRDIDNMAREHEAQVSQLRQATERYEAIKPYDELARSNGRDLRESLAKLSEIEDLMQANPYAGLNAILQEIGPKRPDGSAVTLFEVAQFITQQGPQKWQQIVGARPQAQNDQRQRVDPQVEALQRELAQVKTQQVTASVIEPFKAAHPRYEELKSDIAMFLKSGRIPASLSPVDRLAAAYDMAERLNPPSVVAEPAPKPSPDADGRVDTSSGSKSIKSAPGSSSPDLAPERGGSIRDLLADEMRRKRAS